MGIVGYRWVKLGKVGSSAVKCGKLGLSEVQYDTDHVVRYGNVCYRVGKCVAPFCFRSDDRANSQKRTYTGPAVRCARWGAERSEAQRGLFILNNTKRW